MSVPSFIIRLKEIQKGAHDFKLNKVPLYSRKSVIINVSLSAAPKPKCLCQVSLGLKEVQMTSNLTRASFFLKNSEYQCFALCFPETSSCASKPLYLRCKVVKPECLCQVSLGLKEIQMGAHDFKLNKVHFSALK